MFLVQKGDSGQYYKLLIHLTYQVVIPEGIYEGVQIFRIKSSNCLCRMSLLIIYAHVTCQI